MSARGQHLSDAWYLDHASGNLSLGERLFMSSHIEMSREGAQKLAAFEAIGGQILAQLDADPGDLDSLDFNADDIFARDRDEREDIHRRAPGAIGPAGAAQPAYLPAAIAHYLDDSKLSVHWRFLGPKLRKCLLWKDEDGTQLWMLKAEGGAVIPSHSHRGYELTLVLKGSFHDQTHRFMPGDVQEADDDTEHDILIDDGETCVCLALTQAPLTFSNPLLRVYQAFAGI